MVSFCTYIFLFVSTYVAHQGTTCLCFRFPVINRGVSALLYDSSYCQIEAHQSLVPHSLSLHMATGKNLWFVIGCYVSM